MFVEMAVDRIKNDTAYADKHRAMLDATMQGVQSGFPGQSDEFYAGYMLGLETARILLEGMPNAVAAGVVL
jgi:hypothetical protein